MSITNNVCAKCFQDESIIKYIEQHGKNGQCSYCNQNEIVLSMKDLSDYFNRCLDMFFDRDINPYSIDMSSCVHNILREKANASCYMFRDGSDTWEDPNEKLGDGSSPLANLLIDEYAPERQTHNDLITETIFDAEELNCLTTKALVSLIVSPKYSALIDDLCSLLEDNLFIRKKFRIKGVDEEFKDKWDLFSYYTQHVRRFFFAFNTSSVANSNCHDICYAYDSLPDLLQNVKIVIDNHFPQCLSEITTSDKLYRARSYNYRHRDNIIEDDLLSVPAKYAKSPNRMSAAGISYFYCAKDKTTVIDETRTTDMFDCFVGEWSVCKKQTVMDFGAFIDYPEMMQEGETVGDDNVIKLTPDFCVNKISLPSIFDETCNYLYYDYLFIRSFARNFCDSSSSSDDKMIYIPTQVITEYLKEQYSDKIQGITYQSALTRQHNYCLFYNYDEMKKSKAFHFENCYRYGPVCEIERHTIKSTVLSEIK